MRRLRSSAKRKRKLKQHWPGGEFKSKVTDLELSSTKTQSMVESVQGESDKAIKDKSNLEEQMSQMSTKNYQLKDGSNILEQRIKLLEQ